MIPERHLQQTSRSPSGRLQQTSPPTPCRRHVGTLDAAPVPDTSALPPAPQQGRLFDVRVRTLARPDERRSTNRSRHASAVSLRRTRASARLPPRAAEYAARRRLAPRSPKTPTAMLPLHGECLPPTDAAVRPTRTQSQSSTNVAETSVTIDGVSRSWTRLASSRPTAVVGPPALTSRALSQASPRSAQARRAHSAPVPCASTRAGLRRRPAPDDGSAPARSARPR